MKKKHQYVAKLLIRAPVLVPTLTQFVLDFDSEKDGRGGDFRKLETGWLVGWLVFAGSSSVLVNYNLCMELRDSSFSDSAFPIRKERKGISQLKWHEMLKLWQKIMFMLNFSSVQKETVTIMKRSNSRSSHVFPYTSNHDGVVIVMHPLTFSISHNLRWFTSFRNSAFQTWRRDETNQA